MGDWKETLSPCSGSMESQQLGRPLDPLWDSSLLSPCPLSSHLLMTLGTVTWNCWALLGVVQRLISTYLETDDDAMGREAKHGTCPKPGLQPIFPPACVAQPRGPPYVSSTRGAAWGASGPAERGPQTPFHSLRLCPSPHIPETDQL